MKPIIKSLKEQNIRLREQISLFAGITTAQKLKLARYETALKDIVKHYVELGDFGKMSTAYRIAREALG